MKTIAAMLLASAATSASAAIPPARPETTRLPNGLTVILMEPRAPLIAVRAVLRRPVNDAAQAGRRT
jgi:hypothetical protein